MRPEDTAHVPGQMVEVLRASQGGNRFGKSQSSPTSVLGAVTGWALGEGSSNTGALRCFPGSPGSALASNLCKQKGFGVVSRALKLPLLAPCLVLAVAFPHLGLLSRAQGAL